MAAALIAAAALGGRQVLIRQAADDAFAHASARSTAEAWEELLTRWPDHPRRTEARSALDEIRRLEAEARAFEDALDKDSAEGWVALIERWPDHPRLAEANLRRAQAEAFEQAQALSTMKGWDSFLSAWPEHPRLAEAEAAWYALGACPGAQPLLRNGDEDEDGCVTMGCDDGTAVAWQWSHSPLGWARCAARGPERQAGCVELPSIYGQPQRGWFDGERWHTGAACPSP